MTKSILLFLKNATMISMYYFQNYHAKKCIGIEHIKNAMTGRLWPIFLIGTLSKEKINDPLKLITCLIVFSETTGCTVF